MNERGNGSIYVVLMMSIMGSLNGGDMNMMALASVISMAIGDSLVTLGNINIIMLYSTHKVR